LDKQIFNVKKQETLAKFPKVSAPVNDKASKNKMTEDETKEDALNKEIHSTVVKIIVESVFRIKKDNEHKFQMDGDLNSDLNDTDTHMSTIPESIELDSDTEVNFMRCPYHCRNLTIIVVNILITSLIYQWLIDSLTIRLIHICFLYTFIKER